MNDLTKEVVRKFLDDFWERQIVRQVFLNKLSKDLKLGQELLGACFLCTLSTITVHVTGTIKFQTVKLTYLLLINFLSTLRRWQDENWPRKSWSLLKLSRSLIFSRPVSLSSLLMYVVVGLPHSPSLPSVGHVGTHGISCCAGEWR